MTAALVIDLDAGFGSNAIRTQNLFKDEAAAAAAFERIRDALKAYHARANDREQVISFTHLGGETAVDVSKIVAISYADPLGDARPDYEAWERGMSEVRAEGVRAAAAITNPTN